jgi:uncharacterized DUF497 family protein
MKQTHGGVSLRVRLGSRQGANQFRQARVDFERAATVFLDPLAVTIPDDEHSATESRWITLGKDTGGRDVLVVHTFEWLADDRSRVRLISARKPTRAEIRDYEEQA